MVRVGPGGRVATRAVGRLLTPLPSEISLPGEFGNPFSPPAVACPERPQGGPTRAVQAAVGPLGPQLLAPSGGSRDRMLISPTSSSPTQTSTIPDREGWMWTSPSSTNSWSRRLRSGSGSAAIPAVTASTMRSRRYSSAGDQSDSSPPYAPPRRDQGPEPRTLRTPSSCWKKRRSEMASGSASGKGLRGARGLPRRHARPPGGLTSDGAVAHTDESSSPAEIARPATRCAADSAPNWSAQRPSLCGAGGGPRWRRSLASVIVIALLTDGRPVPEGVQVLAQVVTRDDFRSIVARPGLALEPNSHLPDDGLVSLAYTYHDAGKLLGDVSERTVRRLVAAGELAVVDVGGQRRIARADLERYLIEHRRIAASTARSTS